MGVKVKKIWVTGPTEFSITLKLIWLDQVSNGKANIKHGPFFFFT